MPCFMMLGLLIGYGMPAAPEDDCRELATPGWHFAWFDTEVVRAVAVDPWNANVVFAATGDGLFRSIDRGASFSPVRNGFHYPIFDPFDSSKVYGLLSEGSRSDGIWVSDDLGDTWQVLRWCRYPTALALPAPGEMLLGTKGEGVFLSRDSGATWVSRNAGLEDRDIFSLCCFDPTDSSTIFLAGTGKGLYRLAPPDTDWTVATCPKLPVRSMATSSHGTPLFAAVGGGSDSDGIYGSDDFGLTWQLRTWSQYPSSVVLNALAPNTVYAADSADGVFVSRDTGLTWNPMNQGLGNLCVLCLAQSNRDTTSLYAGNVAGLWRFDFSVSLEERKTISGIRVSAPPITGKRISIRYYLPAHGPRADIGIFDPKGARIAQASGSDTPGWHTADFVPGRAGVYFCRMKAGPFESVQKIIVAH